MTEHCEYIVQGNIHCKLKFFKPYQGVNFCRRHHAHAQKRLKVLIEHKITPESSTLNETERRMLTTYLGVAAHLETTRNLPKNTDSVESRTLTHIENLLDLISNEIAAASSEVRLAEIQQKDVVFFAQTGFRSIAVAVQRLRVGLFSEDQK